MAYTPRLMMFRVLRQPFVMIRSLDNDSTLRLDLVSIRLSEIGSEGGGTYTSFDDIFGFIARR